MFSLAVGSQTAISCSSLYATCSALSLRLLSIRSSLVSTLVGGGVSLGSYKHMFSYYTIVHRVIFRRIHLPQNDEGSRPPLNSPWIFFHGVIWTRGANMVSVRGAQTTPTNLAVETASF